MKKLFTYLLFTALLPLASLNLMAADHIVTISGNTFSPEELTINEGETVMWINDSGTHNVNGSLSTYPDNPEGFFSGDPDTNWEFEFTFTEPGTYDYRCDLHWGGGMVGSVVVMALAPEAEWIDPPADTSITCEQALSFEPGDLSYSNHADGDDEISGSVSAELSGVYDECGGELSASWTFTDEYDRTIEYTQTITVQAAPQAEFVTLPQDTIIACAEAPEFEVVDLTLTNQADSTCEISGIVAGEWNSPFGDCGEQYTINWVFTDACDRVSEHSQIVTVESAPSPYTTVSIPELRENDSLGIPLLLDSLVEVTGIVYGTNLRPQGLQFTIIDTDNVGVGVFNASGDLDYSVNEGDMITVRGVMAQFNGLAQVEPDEIDFISADNELVEPEVVTDLGEDTESALIVLENVVITNPEDWPTPGDNADIFVENEHGTFLMRIQREVDLGSNPPLDTFDLIGIGGQFTTEIPANDGYQIIPRYKADLGIEDEPDEYLSRTIPEIRENDGDFITIYLGEKVEVSGIVYGSNLRPQGLEFTIIDHDNVGVGVFSPSSDFGYSVNEGDSITIRGTVDQFRGLVQINPDEIDFISADNELVEPQTVTQFGEETESSLIKLEQVSIVDPSDWPTPGTSANVEVENEHGIFLMRIHREVNLGFNPPEGEFDLIGIGGQFTTDIPADNGYQILPRYAEDLGIDLEDPYTPVTMPELRENDADGIPVLIGEPVEVTAVVYGINQRPAGLQFTLIDENNVGVGIFRASGNLGYEVNEGDLITLKGIVSQFRGLTQINAEEIEFIEADQPLVEPRIVDELNESTESSLIKLENVFITNPEDWPAAGDEANIILEGLDGSTFVMRVTRESRLGVEALPTLLDVTGIGTQFTFDIPADNGYQIVPRYEEDIEIASNVVDAFADVALEAWPNPTSGDFYIESENSMERLALYDLQGRLIQNWTVDSQSIQLDLNAIAPGYYFMKVVTDKGIGLIQLIKD